MRRFLWLVMAFAASTPSAYAQDRSDLPSKAKQILQTYCHSCHGEKGSVEGGLNYLLDRNLLGKRGKIVPGEPAQSRLYQRIERGEMPPQEIAKRPTPTEMAVIKQWIQTGAKDFHEPQAPREVMSHAALYEILWKDLQKQPEGERRFFRYLTIHHLNHEGVSEDERDTFRQAIAKLVNSLSWNRKIVVPAAIDEARTIFRVDLRDYKWSRKTWSQVAGSYPYFYQPRSEAGKQCVEAASGPVFFHADWFAAYATQPGMYYHLLGLPVSAEELEHQLHLNVTENIKSGLALRAGFRDSGEAVNPRIIERHETLFGAYWKTYDSSPLKKSSSLFDQPLLDGSQLWGSRNGQQIIFNLPNGLQAYMAVSDGQRAMNANTLLVRDSRTFGKPIAAGLSCMSCHSQGIVVKNDQMRDELKLLNSKNKITPEELELIHVLYASPTKMRAAMEEDRKRFLAAVALTGAVVGTAEPIVALALQHEANLDLRQLAWELGVAPEIIVKSRNQSLQLSRLVTEMSEKKATMNRAPYAFAELARDLNLGQTRAYFATPAPALSVAMLTPAKGPLARLDPVLKPVPELDPSAKIDMLRTKAADHWICELPFASFGIHTLAMSPDGKWVAVESQPGVLLVFNPTTGEQLPPITAHSGSVRALEFSADGKLLAIGTSTKAAYLWSMDAGKIVGICEGTKGSGNIMKFSPDSKWLVIAGSKLHVFDPHTGMEKMNAFPATGDLFHDVAFSHNGKYLAGAGPSVSVWEFDTKKLVHTYHMPQAGTSFKTLRYSCVAFSRDDKLLATGLRDGNIPIWDLETRTLTDVLKVASEHIKSLHFLPDGKRLLIGGEFYSKSNGGKATLWDLSKKQIVATYFGHRDGPSRLLLNSQGTHFVSSGNADRTICYWTLERDGKPNTVATPEPKKDPTEVLPKLPVTMVTEKFTGHDSAIVCLALPKTGPFIATSSNDGTARLWAFDNGIEHKKLAKHIGSVHAVVFAGDDKTVFTAGADRFVRQWEVQTGKLQRSAMFEGAIRALALAPDRKTLAVATDSKKVLLFDTAAGKTRMLLQHKGDPINALTFSNDYRYLAVLTANPRFTIYNAVNGLEVQTIAGHSGEVNAIAFSPDNRHILSGSTDKTARLWEIETGREVRIYQGIGQLVRGVAFTPDGKTVITSGGMGGIHPLTKKTVIRSSVIYAFDTETGKLRQHWDGFSDVVSTISVTADGQQVVAVAGNTLRTMGFKNNKNAVGAP